ncbi:hypothetical protein JCM30204_01410 [Dysgonomonas termitidis]
MSNYYSGKYLKDKITNKSLNYNRFILFYVLTHQIFYEDGNLILIIYALSQHILNAMNILTHK